jgi:hypothetical protein
VRSALRRQPTIFQVFKKAKVSFESRANPGRFLGAKVSPKLWIRRFCRPASAKSPAPQKEVSDSSVPEALASRLEGPSSMFGGTRFTIIAQIGRTQLRRKPALDTDLIELLALGILLHVELFLRSFKKPITRFRYP